MSYSVDLQGIIVELYYEIFDDLRLFKNAGIGCSTPLDILCMLVHVF